MVIIINSFSNVSRKTLNCNPKSYGIKFRILETGEIIMRYTGKVLGQIEDKNTLENISKLKGRKLDKVLEKFI